MDPVDQARFEKLCPGLRRIVDLELQAGNWVDETWEGWGFVVLLGAPFSRSLPDAWSVGRLQVRGPETARRRMTHGVALESAGPYR
jgi:hypothetical protein